MTVDVVATPVDSTLRDVAAERVNVMRGYLLVCVALVAVGELVIIGDLPFVGIALEALAIVLLAGGRWHFAPHGESAPPLALTYACAAIALVPIMRLLSVTMPLKHASEIAWYALIGFPLLVVLVPLMGEQEHLRSQLRVHGHYFSQALIALGGIPLGLLAYAIATPDQLDSGSIFENPLVALVILTVFSGLVEELIFRGVLLDALDRFFGPALGLLTASVLFAIVSGAAGGLWFALFAFAYGYAFGMIVRRSGSLVGVSVAHGLLNTGLIIVWPMVFG